MKVKNILEKYDLLSKRGTWNYSTHKMDYNEPEINVFYHGNCEDGGKKTINNNITTDVIAHHLEDYGGFFISRGKTKYYAFVVFSNKFCVGGMNYKSHRITDLSDVYKKIDITKLTIDDKEEYDKFLKQTEKERLLSLAKEI